MKRDFYEVMEVPKTASQDEIKKSYRNLARMWHPDRNPGDSEAEKRFKEVQEAYDVLSDQNRRHHYDMHGHDRPQMRPHSRPPGDIFDSIFQGFFHQGQQRQHAARDIQMEVEVEFMEAALGTQKSVRFNRNEPCADCGTTGAHGQDGLETCKLCDGRGRMVQNHSFVRLETRCPQCHGRGKVIVHPCGTCHGQGQVGGAVELNVRIPEGAFDGMRLCLRGQGEVNLLGGTRGDLFIDLRVAQHEFFGRDEENLTCVIPISYSTAVLGGEVSVPGLREEKTIQIRPGTQSGDIISLDSEGFPDVYYPSKRGDFIITVQVETPTELTPEYSELLKKLAEMEESCPSEKIKAFKSRKVNT